MLNNYILSAVFMIIILGILSVRAITAIRQKKSLLCCFQLIGATAIYVVLDALFIACHLNSNKISVTTWKIVSFLFFVIYIILPFIWHLFIRNFVGTDFKPIIRVIECVPLLFLLCLAIITPFIGILYDFNAEDMYVRGSFYTWFSYLNYFYYVEPIIDLIIIFARKKEKSERYIIQSVLISLVPLVGAIINNFVIPQGTIFPLQPFCSTIVAMLGFFFIATKDSDMLKDKQQQAIEEALVKSREASQVKSRFLSDMSHDIRTPMNAIVNLVDLARKEKDIKVIQQYLDKMSVSSKFLLGLISDILDMSRIESGDLVFHKENLTRSEFLNTIDTVISPLMKTKKIHYHPELNPGKYTISVDKLRFNQIFFNLLSNAVKYTPDGGDIWFEVRNIEAENDKLKILFIVRDNGIGMSEEFTQHLFEPFAREETEYNIKTQGTGLGLSIVKKLIDAMNGTITVKSKLGEGSEFSVMFYVDIVAREELHETVNQPDEEVNLNGLRVMVVEDNELNSFVTKTLLEKAGCTVTLAENGKKAVELFTENNPFSFDAILMDMRMPVMDGITATKLIRKSGKADAKNIPIIAVTADVFDDERKNIFDAGMTYYLPKPISADKLYNTLKKCTPPPEFYGKNTNEQGINAEPKV